MKLARRTFVYLALGAAVLPLVPRNASGQVYPTRPVRMIVGLSARRRRPTSLARLIGQWLSERLGQPFVIENRPGAGNNIGTEAVVKCAAGRLHAAAGQPGERDQRVALREAQLQFHPRHRAGRGHHARAERDGGQPVGSGQDRCGVHRLRQGQSGQGQHGLGRQRHVGPSVGRTVQDDDRRRHAARALSRRGARADRPDRRAGAGACSTTCRPRSSTSGPASCARWR